jgi:hypothetical protein
MRWNCPSKKLFLFIISLLIVIPTFSMCAMATDATSILSTKSFPGFPIDSVLNKNNTTKITSGDIAPLSTDSGDDSPTSASLSDTSKDTSYSSTTNTDQSETPPDTASREETILYYEEQLTAHVTEVKPSLSLKCPDRVAAGSLFKVLATANGIPPEKVTIVFIHQTVLTDLKGVAYLQAPQVPEEMKIPISALKDGYNKYTTYVHIIPTHANIISNIPITDGNNDFSSPPPLFSQNPFTNLVS